VNIVSVGQPREMVKKGKLFKLVEAERMGLPVAEIGAQLHGPHNFSICIFEAGDSYGNREAGTLLLAYIHAWIAIFYATWMIELKNSILPE